MHNNIDWINVNDEFESLGEFSLSSDLKNNLKGILTYKNGQALLRLFDKFSEFSNINRTIYGKIICKENNKIYVRLNEVYLVNNWKIKGCNYAYKTSNIDLSENSFDEKFEIHEAVTFIPEVSYLLKDSFEIIDLSDSKDNDFDSSFTPTSLSDTRDSLNRFDEKRLNLYTTFNTTFNSKLFNEYLQRVLHLISLFACQIPSVLSIVYNSKDRNKSFVHLDSNLRVLSNNPKEVLGALTNFKDKISVMFKKISANDMNRLTTDFYYGIDNNLNPEVELINYAGAIEYYVAGKRYSNGRSIKNFSKKLSYFIDQIPFTVIRNDKKDFIKSIKDTRDYLLHGDKKNSEFLLHGIKLMEYDDDLKKLIYCFIMSKLGLSEEYINFLSNSFRDGYGLKYYRMNY